MQRDVALSCVRLIAMVMIITCHVLQAYDNMFAWWLNVGVQLFFMISGFIYGTRDVVFPLRFIVTRFLRLAIPFYLFLLFALGLYVIVGERFSAKQVVSLMLMKKTVRGLGHLWFVPHMLFCCIITPYLQLVRDKIVRMPVERYLKAIMMFMVGFLIWEFLFGRQFDPPSTMCYVIGYFYSVTKKHFGDMIFRRIGNTMIIVGFAAIAVRIFIEKQGVLCGVIPYLRAMIGVGLFYLLYHIAERIACNRILMFTDRFSYDIYLSHHIFLLGPLSIIDNDNGCMLSSSDWVRLFLALVMGIVLGILLNVFRAKLVRISINVDM